MHDEVKQVIKEEFVKEPVYVKEEGIINAPVVTQEKTIVERLPPEYLPLRTEGAGDI